jgi:hypothetical protein
MDEAFAGGVCRCRHCGAIQTVPTHLKFKNTAATTKKKAGRTLYSKRAGGDAIPSSGLDQLAQVVASSGLSSEALKARGRKKPTRKEVFLVGVSAGIGLILIIVGVGVALTRGKSAPTASGAAVTASSIGSPAESSAVLASPNFCGIPITDRIVVYVLDRGSATGELFSYLKEASFKSATSLGPERKFQIIFWNNGGQDDAFPDSAPTYATATNVEAARRALDGVYAFGQSEIGSALTKAIASNPERIMIATGKGAQLGDEFVQQVLSIRKDRPVKIDTIDIGSPALTPALKTIADRTGGNSQLLAEADLKRYGKN